jgi:hypothetical protein
MKQSPLQRIIKVMNYYYRQGANKESVNNVYKNILKKKYEVQKTRTISN